MHVRTCAPRVFHFETSRLHWQVAGTMAASSCQCRTRSTPRTMAPPQGPHPCATQAATPVAGPGDSRRGGVRRARAPRASRCPGARLRSNGCAASAMPSSGTRARAARVRPHAYVLGHCWHRYVVAVREALFTAFFFLKLASYSRTRLRVTVGLSAHTRT